MKNKLKKIKNKRITLQEAVNVSMFVLVIVLGIICIIKTPFRKYSYVDLNNNWGDSYKCYKHKGKLVCEVRKEVKQYYVK